jgi:hypothetical protein
MSYEPRPGTVAWKALQHLETLPAGAEILGSALAEAIGAEPYQIQPCMLALIAAKMAYRRQKDEHLRSPWWYSLTDHSKIPRAPVQRVALPSATEHTPQGANRDASAEQSHVAEASASAAGQGANGPTARGAAPASSSPEVGGLIDLHMVVRVTTAQAEQIVRLLQQREAA